MPHPLVIFLGNVRIAVSHKSLDRPNRDRSIKDRGIPPIANYRLTTWDKLADRLSQFRNRKDVMIVDGKNRVPSLDAHLICRASRRYRGQDHPIVPNVDVSFGEHADGGWAVRFRSSARSRLRVGIFSFSRRCQRGPLVLLWYCYVVVVWLTLKS